MRLYNDKLGLYYEVRDNYIVIDEGEHNLETADIPADIDGMPVKVINKKAYLGCKLLKSVTIPDSIESIGDFAFAMCDHLSVVSLPQKDIKLGKSIFKNDQQLSAISVRSLTDSDELRYLHAAHLLAAAPNTMDAEYLIDIPAVGGRDWFRMWDQKLCDILSRKNDEGYHLYVLCGEEDLHFDYDQFVEYTRQKKSELCILRLLNDCLLDENLKLQYIDFLKENTTDPKNSPVFNLLTGVHGDDEEYYDVLIRSGIITDKNREVLLQMLGDRHLQTKTFLINAFTDNNNDDFFSDLML